RLGRCGICPAPGLRLCAGPAARGRGRRYRCPAPAVAPGSGSGWRPVTCPPVPAALPAAERLNVDTEGHGPRLQAAAGHAQAGFRRSPDDRCVPVRLTASLTVSCTSNQVSRPVTARIL